MRRTQHTLTGSTFRNLVRLLRDNRWDTDLPSAVAWCLGVSAVTAPVRALESALTARRVARTTITDSPVFILGHWRTGTTHLHNLLAQDPRFGYVSTVQSLFPQLSATGRPLSLAIMKTFGPSTRPMDNMQFGPLLPQEEEFGVANISRYSAYNAIFFPRRAREYFSRFVTFDMASQRDVEGWKAAYLWMLKKATLLNGGRRIVSKNPPNTARVPQLLELFPDAKFIHIFRNPYTVYFSTRRLYDKLLRGLALQEVSDDETDRLLIEFYRQMMSSFFSHAPAIPAGNLVEISYEDLDSRPLGLLEDVYRALGLGAFEVSRPRFESYLQRIGDYTPNDFSYDPGVVRRISDEWGFTIRRWGYQPPRIPAGAAIRSLG